MIDIAYIGSWKHFVFVFVCVCVSLSLYLSFCKSLFRSLSSPDDKLSENIWFVWSRTSYGGDKWRCYNGDNEQTSSVNGHCETEFSNFAQFWLLSTIFGRLSLSCPGSLITSTYFISAAHCNNILITGDKDRVSQWAGKTSPLFRLKNTGRNVWRRQRNTENIR